MPFQSPPPFLSLLRKNTNSFIRNVLRGANFASGGAGLLDMTGKRPYKRVIPIAEQVQQFAKVRQVCSKALKNQTQARFFKSLFLLSVGSNDLFEYFLYNQTKTNSGEDFIAHLLSSYETHLRTLLQLGAKRFGIVGVGPIGCCPIIRIQNFKDGKWSGNGGKLNAEERCKPGANSCKDRNDYLFWDQFHPTEIAYKIAAMALYSGGDQTIALINISQLAILKF
ncbi:hypothetical protein TIFTF001_002189 [Ficus carica]|uniref:GDSL esterase/lipase n=1 Tax=Ficus carica TaxID=3494 RepID=A0AA87Z3L4_FICCA|nr:hypothetical protein TIFTF001_002189 [Ficus carica]